MNSYKFSIGSFVIYFLLAGFAAPVFAGMWDDPKNLQALPEEITPAELRATMRGFASNTGSRCSTCHVGEVENDFSTYDFSLDDKEKKRKARIMIRMVSDINQRLADTLGKPVADLVSVDCATCHRGQVKPEMLQNILAATYREDSLDKAVEQYRSLRQRYYGGYTYDFSPVMLMIVAEELAGANDFEAALGFLNLNLEFYPESARTYVLQAQIHNANGDVPAARKSFHKALEIEPENQWTQRMLAALDAD